MIRTWREPHFLMEHSSEASFLTDAFFLFNLRDDIPGTLLCKLVTSAHDLMLWQAVFIRDWAHDYTDHKTPPKTSLELHKGATPKIVSPLTFS